VLAGLVERVTFNNAENGFCVLGAKARGHRDLVTVVGHAAVISADAVDKAYKTYNEGRLAFRQYFATCGPNVKQNDQRMPPNPHLGYYEGLAWLYGFESELRRHVVINPSMRGFRGIRFR
jgi:hypothetical protein